MAKQADVAILWLIIGGIIISPFVFLYNTIGLSGLIAIIIIVLGWVKWFFHSRNKISNRIFQKLALDTITNKINQSEYKQINIILMRKDYRKGELIRNMQIINDSIYIALNSKKKDIAQSRIDMVAKLWDDINKSHFKLLSDEVQQVTKNTIEGALSQYHTVSYVNIANAYIEKASTLKTEKGKNKYLSLAREVISEGMFDPLSNKEDLAAVNFQLK